MTDLRSLAGERFFPAVIFLVDAETIVNMQRELERKNPVNRLFVSKRFRPVTAGRG